MNVLTVLLSFALAALAFPTASADPAPPEVPEKPLQCTYEGGDRDCRGELGPCWVHTHTYDVEDALNVYEVSCHDCGVHVGAGGVKCTLLDQLVDDPTDSMALAPPIQTYCWAMEDGSGCRTTFRVGAATCGYTSGHWGGQQHASADCATEATGSCHATLLPVQAAPPAGCDALPIGPSAMAADLEIPPFPCQDGIAQTWCDVTVGPCDIRVVPWTAWGDQYVTMDCQGGGAGLHCYFEAHTQDPLDPAGWCAFAAPPAQPLPCHVSPPFHAGVVCTIRGQECSALVWVDGNPPNPTLGCE